MIIKLTYVYVYNRYVRENLPVFVIDINTIGGGMYDD